MIKRSLILAVSCILASSAAMAAECVKFEGTVDTMNTSLYTQSGSMAIYLVRSEGVTTHHAAINGQIVGQNGPVTLLNHTIEIKNADGETIDTIFTEGDIAAGFPTLGDACLINVEEKLNFSTAEGDNFGTLIPTISAAQAQGTVDICPPSENYTNRGNHFTVSGLMCFEGVAPASRR